MPTGCAGRSTPSPGDATALAPGRFRLSKLLRGRRGSEWAMGSHAIGDNFALLDARTIKAIPLPAELIGSIVAVTAYGPGDMAGPPAVSRAAMGEAMRPLSPAHLCAQVAPDGSLSIRWVRRSRLAWSWLDELGAPPDPSLLGYRLRIAGSSGMLELDIPEEEALLSSAEVASLGSGLAEIEVRQIGTLALSRSATIILDLQEMS